MNVSVFLNTDHHRCLTVWILNPYPGVTLNNFLGCSFSLGLFYVCLCRAEICFDISAPPPSPSQLSYDEYTEPCTVIGKMRRRGRGLANHPHMLRPRKWSRYPFITMAVLGIASDTVPPLLLYAFIGFYRRDGFIGALNLETPINTPRAFPNCTRRYGVPAPFSKSRKIF